jgi:hypothetical protein
MAFRPNRCKNTNKYGGEKKITPTPTLTDVINSMQTTVLYIRESYKVEIKGSGGKRNQPCAAGWKENPSRVKGFCLLWKKPMLPMQSNESPVGKEMVQPSASNSVKSLPIEELWLNLRRYYRLIHFFLLIVVAPK